MYLNLNDSDDVWDYEMRQRTLEMPAGVACSEPVAPQRMREGDPIWAKLMLAAGVTFLGSALLYFTTVVLL